MTAPLMHRHSNPGAFRSAAGAVGGGLLGGLTMVLITHVGMRLKVGGDPHDVPYFEDRPGYVRALHAMIAAGTAAGAAYGAYLAALPFQKRQAFAGAMVGSLLFGLPSIAVGSNRDYAGEINWIGSSLAAGAGAAIGAAKE